jgi:hypothetical protein
MKLPRLRFTLRRMMVAVVIAGIAFGGLAGLLRMGQRTQRLRAVAREHRQREIVNSLTLQGLAMQGAASPGIERHRMLAEYHRALNLKYEYAARHPWLTVEPDPPMPK